MSNNATESSLSRRRLSVVTPTLHRPVEIAGLIENLRQQTCPPAELIVIDGAPRGERATELVLNELTAALPFPVRYVRHDKGTAIQRNAGIELAQGDFVSFIDDDVRLEADFFANMIAAFAQDDERKIGGIVGYRTNQHFRLEERQRWRWYRRLKLLTTFEPGQYDFKCGYPINNSMQPPFSGTRKVHFMTTACAVWRREVLDAGLRFDPFFRDYGVLEDAHFSLRAGRNWELLQCGDARCVELNSPNGRVNRRKIGYKSVVNYYYVFQDVVRPLTWRHKTRFWRYQAFELLRVAASAVCRKRWSDVLEVRGRLEGVMAVARGVKGIKQN